MIFEDYEKNIPDNFTGTERRSRLKYITIGVLGSLVLLFSLTLGPWWLLKAYKSSDRYREKQRKKEEQRSLRPPKVILRKRALSISEQFMNSRSTNQQEQSRLCILPAELRLKFYDEVIGARTGIHIVFVEGSLHSYRCRWSRDLILPVRHIHCWNHYCNESRTLISNFNADCSILGVLALLQSCRLIYTECVPQFYSRPTFFFHDYISFIAFCGTIIPKRFNNIQSITFYMASSSTDSNFPDHIRQNIFTLFGTYEPLHTYGVQLRNPILPRIGPQRVEQRKWTQVRKILRQMSALKELKAATYANAFTLVEEEDPYDDGDLTENTALLRGPVNRLWPANIINEWRDFEFFIDVFHNGRTWQSEYYLKRKRRSGSKYGEEASSTSRTVTN